MLVELAIGDAYGAGFEYSEPAFVTEHNTLGGYVRHPRHVEIRPGMYTDDTQMTLAIVESLLSDEDWTPENLAERFVGVYRRDERYGYSRRIHDLLRAAGTGAQFLSQVDRRSDRSGAAMRVTPLGLLADPQELMHRAEVQARVTHDTDDAVEAAHAAALAVHYCHHRLGPTTGLPAWLDDRLPGDWLTPWRGKVGAQGLMSARASVTALSSAVSLSRLLRTCVAWTGDVDTVAAVALAAGSRATDIDQDLPPHLHDTLENGDYGLDYLRDLDRHLLARFPARPARSEPDER